MTPQFLTDESPQDARAGHGMPRASMLYVLFVLSNALTGCAQDATMVRSLSPDNVGAERLTDQDAFEIAQGFVDFQSERGGRPEWAGAFASTSVPFYDMEGTIQAYEVKVVTPAKDDAGWITVESAIELPPVSAYATGGETQSEELLGLYATRSGLQPGDLSATDFDFLWAGPSSASMIDPDGEVLHPAYSLALADFDGDLRLATLAAMPADADDAELGVSREEQYRSVRAVLESGDTTSPLLDGAIGELRSVDGAGVTEVRSGAASISNFIQVRDTWDHSASGGYYCYSGCAPNGFSQVAEYWDRYGYPTLVGTSADNSNTTFSSATGDADVWDTLDGFRDALLTFCTSSGAGSTYVSNLGRGINYINTRGAGTWTTLSYIGTSADQQAAKWLVVQSEVTQWHPFAFSYRVPSPGNATAAINHTTAGYGFEDNAGSATDYVCTEKGWASSGTTWECVSRVTAGNWRIDTISPP